MKNISKATVDTNLRKTVFNTLNISNLEGFRKINERCFGILLLDENGVERYVRVSAIVAEQRDDATAAELMQAEIDDYNAKQAAKAEKAKARAEKAAKDKAKREAAKAKTEASEGEGA